MKLSKDTAYLVPNGARDGKVAFWIGKESGVLITASRPVLKDLEAMEENKNLGSTSSDTATTENGEMGFFHQAMQNGGVKEAGRNIQTPVDWNSPAARQHFVANADINPS